VNDSLVGYSARWGHHFNLVGLNGRGKFRVHPRRKQTSAEALTQCRAYTTEKTARGRLLKHREPHRKWYDKHVTTHAPHGERVLRNDELSSVDMFNLDWT
jgi:hypothetical protein